MAASRKKLVWIASYPKSGNTWMRLFLAHYLLAMEGPALPFEAVQRISVSDARASEIERRAGGPEGMVGRRAIGRARLDWLESLASRPNALFVKTHAANVSVAQRAVIPPALTRASLYLVRDPRDVVISFAEHMGVGLEEAVARMAASDTVLGGRDGRQVSQAVGGWSEHVRSWQGAEGLGVLVLRFEDMLRDPAAAFARALGHVGLPVELARMARAIEATSFDRLAAREAGEGFFERKDHQERFFSRGTAGHWTETLPPALAERIARDHGPAMRTLGYL